MGVRLLDGTFTNPGPDDIVGDVADGTPTGWLVMSNRIGSLSVANHAHTCLGVGDGTNSRCIATHNRTAVDPPQVGSRTISDRDMMFLNPANGVITAESTGAAIPGGVRFTHSDPPNATRFISMLQFYDCQAEAGNFQTTGGLDVTTQIPLAMGWPDAVFIISTQGLFQASPGTLVSGTRATLGFAAIKQGQVAGQGSVTWESQAALVASPADVSALASRDHVAYSSIGGGGVGTLFPACQLSGYAGGFNAINRHSSLSHNLGFLAVKFSDDTQVLFQDRFTSVSPGGVRVEDGYAFDPTVVFQAGTNTLNSSEWDVSAVTTRASLFAYGAFSNTPSGTGGTLVDKSTYWQRDMDAAQPTVANRQTEVKAYKTVAHSDGSDLFVADSPVFTTRQYTLDWVTGNSNARCIPSIIFGVFTPPVAEFIGVPLTGAASLNVQFTDLSFFDITAWLWDFGDLSPTSALQNPLHTYTTPGTYTVTLTVTSPGGMDTETKVDYVIVTPGADKISGPAVGDSPRWQAEGQQVERIIAGDAPTWSEPV